MVNYHLLSITIDKIEHGGMTSLLAKAINISLSEQSETIYALKPQPALTASFFQHIIQKNNSVKIVKTKRQVQYCLPLVVRCV